MGIGDRPAACASCGKRLNRKQWYYRNGKYFCKKRCWVTENAKATEAATAKAAEGTAAQAKEPATAPAASEPAKAKPAES